LLGVIISAFLLFVKKNELLVCVAQINSLSGLIGALFFLSFISKLRVAFDHWLYYQACSSIHIVFANHFNTVQDL